MEKTTIWISKKLKKELDDLGKKGDTYEEIIWRLIKKCKSKKQLK